MGLLCNAYMKYDAITMGVEDILLKPEALAKYVFGLVAVKLALISTIQHPNHFASRVVLLSLSVTEQRCH